RSSISAIRRDIYASVASRIPFIGVWITSFSLLLIIRNETTSRSIPLNMFLIPLTTIYTLMCVNLGCFY
ncbi:unnamed protein product, partial [Brassica oleracea var. botrytis]